MPGVAPVGYDNDAYELRRDETAPVGCAEQFTASSVPLLPRARVPLASFHLTRRNRRCVAACYRFTPSKSILRSIQSIHSSVESICCVATSQIKRLHQQPYSTSPDAVDANQ